MFRLLRLHLTDFRSYAALTWQPAARVAVVTGPNGSGKTNLLEAVSLLAPGRGLRGARIAELPRQGGAGESTGAWGVAARVLRDGEEREVATGSPPEGPGDRRVFRLDGAPPRTHAELAGLAPVLWLTPQMDRLFQEGASGRRRFLDRLAWGLEPGHAREVSAYETAMSGRNRLLADSAAADPAWLAALEDTMARHAVAVTASRLNLAARLNGALASGASGGLPAARLEVLCPVADRLTREPAVRVEDWLRCGLARNRRRDAAAGGAALGAHRADMGLIEAASGLPASRASTGQQKTLLLGLVLGHAALIGETRGTAPLLLLDEPMVHLDAARRAALIAALLECSAQAILTGTDNDVFAGFRGHAEGLRTEGGNLRQDRGFLPIS